MMMKSRPKPLAGVTTSNYFDALRSVEVDLDCCSATLDEVSTPRFQIVPRKVKAPQDLLADWNAIVSGAVREATLRESSTEGYVTQGKNQVHTEHLSFLLAEMQSLARAHPEAVW